MIYLPLHRSHLDYILITFILWNYDIRAPYVAAGDNMNIPFFRSVDMCRNEGYVGGRRRWGGGGGVERAQPTSFLAVMQPVPNSHGLKIDFCLCIV